jgi:hypothetical protein
MAAFAFSPHIKATQLEALKKARVKKYYLKLLSINNRQNKI